MVTAAGETPGRVVLVVDDDEVTREVAQTFLEENGFSVEQAEDGARALELLERIQPDLVLLDVEMPNLDGFETCAHLRQMPHLRSMPVMMTTARDDTPSIDRAYAVGATDFVTKPVNWTILIRRIRYMLRSNEALRDLARAQRIARLGSWRLDPAGGAMVWSEEVYQILSLEPGAVDPSLDLMLECIPGDDRERVTSWFEGALHGAAERELTHRALGADQSERIVQQQLGVLRDAGGALRRVSGTIQDITEREQSAAHLRRLAFFDDLTGLPNRESYRESLEQAVAIAGRHGRALAVLYLDLDDFKRVNDTLGHSTGDELLRTVAKRLHDELRSSDQVTRVVGEGDVGAAARLGGDEFSILLSEVARPGDVAIVAQRIVDALSEPMRLGTQDVYSGSSIGIAVFPGDGNDGETLLKHADVAMYAAKQAGKNQYRFFDTSMNASAERRLAMDSQLRRAIEREELSLVYQPQVDALTGKVEAVEALLRWNNAQFGQVSPVEFIPLAEERGLIVPIGEWVLRTACTQTRTWREQGVGIERISVNISVLQFAQSDFVDVVSKILEETGLDAHVLELEITEGLLATDADGAVATLHALKALGVILSIDDFGTGYSSLSYLRKFPIDRLKIDRSFIQDLVADPVITSAVIGLAHGMRVKVVAEGVETDEQANLLKAEGCDELQGFYLCRPIPPDELVTYLQGG